MLRVDYRTTYGVVKVRSLEFDGECYNVHIHPANCLCAFIHHFEKDGEKCAQLYSFLADQSHINNIMRSEGELLGGWNVVSVKLNVFHKEARKLILPMSKSGYKVTCYYKEDKL